MAGKYLNSLSTNIFTNKLKMRNEIIFIKKIHDSRTNKLEKPYKLILNLTNRCNSKCNTCNIWQKANIEDFNQELTTEEIKKFFKQNNFFSWIDLVGGEIFLRNDIDQIFDIIIKYSKELVFLHFPTNGSLDKKTYESVKKIKTQFKGRLVITVSIDGYQELHDQIRGINGSWKKAVTTYKLIKSINKETYIGYTISKYNLNQIEKTYISLKKEIPDLKFKDIHFNIAALSDSYYFNSNKEILPEKDQILSEIDYIINKKKKEINPFSLLEKKFFILNKKYIETGKHPLNECSALKTTITIGPKGQVLPCLFFDLNLGNIRTEDYQLTKILSNEKIQKYKENILKYCPHCWSACQALPSIINNRIKS